MKFLLSPAIISLISRENESGGLVPWTGSEIVSGVDV